MTFTVRELTFETNEDCARHFGLCASHVAYMRRDGRADRIGLRTAVVGKWKAKPHRTPNPDLRMQVTVRGMNFRDAYAAAAHFGCRPSTVYSALAEGRIDSLGMPNGPRPGTPCAHTSKPISIGPFAFPSRRAAADFLGVRPTYVERAARGIAGYSWEKVVGLAMAKAAQISRERRKQMDAAA